MPKQHKRKTPKRKNAKKPRENTPGYAMTHHSSMSRRMFLPERYVTEFSNTLNVFQTAGHATAAAGNYTSMVLNSIVYMFNPPTYPTTLVPGAAFAYNAAVVQGNLITQGPIGYVNFAGLYTKYKVHKFRVEIVVIPANSADAESVTFAPLGAEEIPSAAAGSVNTHVMESQPSAVTKIVNAFSSPSGNTLVFEGFPWDYLGVRKEQYLDQAPDAISGFPATPCYGGLFCQQIMGSNNAASIATQITITQIVELSDLVNPIN